MNTLLHLLLLVSTLIFTNCQPAVSQKQAENPISAEKYWSDGLAEVNRYELSQNRYQEVHNGELVLIFVAEDFLTDKQVKNESYKSKHSTKVLKQIEHRQFNTGIYQYNMFTSSFTPFNIEQFPNALKVTSTSQEWCGTTFMQLNKIEGGYKIGINSYFEGEGDATFEVRNSISEEEIFTKLRMNPNLLPIGSFNLIPASTISRLLHLDIKSYSSTGQIKGYTGDVFTGNNLKVYVLNTTSLERIVEIVYEDEAPYKIVGWIDTYPSVFDKKKRQTVVRLTHQIKEAYWKMNRNADRQKRESLGLRSN